MRRELNEMEYFNWTVGQPYDMVLALEVRGTLPPERLRAALDKAQRRHPLLGVNTELGPGGLPWFTSDGVGPIPLAVVDGADAGETQRLAERDLGATFDRDRAGAARAPLMRVTLVRPRDPEGPTGLIFTSQHIVADGLSMVFLVRDLLGFLDEPDAPVTVLDAPARADDLLPARVRRRIPRSPWRFHVALRLLRLFARLRFGRHPAPPPPTTTRTRTWELTPDETSRLRARCRREGVSIQSAICAAFLTSFRSIHTPVSLRGVLARPVGESVGLYVGSAYVRMRYRSARGLWGNARRFQRRLRSALRDPFWVFRLFSKSVSAEEAGALGRLMIRVASSGRPLAITNLGEVDRPTAEGRGTARGLRARDLRIESFFGAVTGIVDSSVLTVYTIDGRMHLHLLASERAPDDRSVRDDAARAVRMLLEASAPAAEARA
jgi:hypothetical protein